MVAVTIPGPISTQLQAILDRDDGADSIALVWPEFIELSAEVQEVAGTLLRIVYCVSELAIREQLAKHQDVSGDERLVILSPFDETRLSKDILARLWGFEPKRISPWRTLEQLLKIKQIDPRLTHKKYRWIAECLVSTYDHYQGHIRFGETLDFDKAWEAIALGLLGYQGASPDLDSLLSWSIDTEASGKVANLPESVAEHLGDWLEPRLNTLTPLVETLWQEGHAGDMLAVGLVCQLLYSERRLKTGDAAILQARGQLTERFLGGQKQDDALLRSYGSAAKTFAERCLTSDHRKINPAFTHAEQILASLDLAGLSIESDLLPAAFPLRLTQFAKALDNAIKGKSIDPAVTVLQTLQNHQLAIVRSDQVEAAQLAVRVCFWLKGLPEDDGSAHGIIRSYVAEGGFLDWARSRIWSGDEHEQLSAVYQRLTKKTAERRDALNQQFAGYLPAIARGDRLGSGIWPVEDTLEQLIIPLAEQQPVLLLVVDGMSQAVYREFADDLIWRRWVELQKTGSEGAECLISALPSITKLSRYSLLAGKVGEGVAANEKKAFTGHPGLKKLTSKAGPILFHKADLQQPGSGGGLSGHVRECIAGDKHRVVAAVINAVDDQLSSNAQIAISWKTGTSKLLQQILEAAKESGRLVIFTSDHGHVLDHDMTYQKTTGVGERYKQADSQVKSGEVLLEGNRVVLAGNKAILPWSEKIRYANKKMGYHGGASLQEVIIPFGVFRNIDSMLVDAKGHELQGWQEVPRQEPAWWRLNAIERAPEPIKIQGVGKVTTSTKKSKKDRQTLDLFADDNAIADAPKSEEQWIDVLFASLVFKEMKARLGRVPVNDDQLRTLLQFLSEREGQQMLDAVVEVLGIPALRIHGLLAGVQKLLNVDGYRVLAIDRSAKTVKLDIGLLKKQFEL